MCSILSPDMDTSSWFLLLPHSQQSFLLHQLSRNTMALGPAAACTLDTLHKLLVLTHHPTCNGGDQPTHLQVTPTMPPKLFKLHMWF